VTEVAEPAGSAGPAEVAGVASQRIADHVRAQILAGVLPPGTRIRQDDLASELGASRLPVREALRILNTGGLVTLEANRGAWVTQLDQDDCELSYEIRERLEPLMLRRSLAGLGPADLDLIESVQVEIEASTDLEEFLVLDRRLHWATYAGAERSELQAMIGRLWDTTHHYRRAFTYLAGAQRRWIINAEHRLLIQALRDGDAVEAERVLAMHIRRTRIELRQHPEVFVPGFDVVALASDGPRQA
jgi:DNA-binding GntR family transcriptional regulator